MQGLAARRGSAPVPYGVLMTLAALGLHSAPAAAQQSTQPAGAAPSAPPDFWHQDTLTGDWGGLRSELAKQGVALTLTYTPEVFANVAGGMKQGAAYDGALLAQVAVDLDKLAGWHGATFQISMLGGSGPALSPGWVGNLMGVSGTAVIPPAIRLYNLWLQQNLFNDTLSVRAGIENVDAEFLNSPTASLFVNTTFGWAEWAAADLPGGGPAYPLSAPFVRVRYSPAPEGFSMQAAVFSGDPTGNDGSNSPAVSIPSGTVVSFTGGAFVIGELDYTMNQAKDAKGPPATFKLGGWYATSTHFQDQRFDTNGLSLASPASNGLPLNHDGNWGIYGIADATLFQASNGGTLSAFLRLAGSPGDRNLISFYADTGVTYKGLIPGRDDDTAGIGFALSRIGGNARGLDQDVQAFTGNPQFPVRNYEAVLELTYQAQLTPWLVMQPTVQAVFHPGGNVLNVDGSVRPNALVLGLHSVVTF